MYFTYKNRLHHWVIKPGRTPTHSKLSKKIHSLYFVDKDWIGTKCLLLFKPFILRDHKSKDHNIFAVISSRPIIDSDNFLNIFTSAEIWRIITELSITSAYTLFNKFYITLIVINFILFKLYNPLIFRMYYFYFLTEFLTVLNFHNFKINKT